MKPLAPLMLAAAVALAQPALGAPLLAPDDPAVHAFGLDGLRWGMGVDAAAHAIAGLTADADGGLGKPVQVFEGCKARLTLAFAAGRLSRIVMIPDADYYSCKVNVVDYIARAYGQPYDVVQGNTDCVFKWRGPTGIVFTTGAVEDLFKGRLELFDNRQPAP